MSALYAIAVIAIYAVKLSRRRLHGARKPGRHRGQLCRPTTLVWEV